ANIMVKKNSCLTAILMACLCIVIAIGFSKIVMSNKTGAPQKEETSKHEDILTEEAANQPVPEKIVQLSTMAVVRKRIKGMNAKNIKRNLKHLTRITHVGGTPGEEELGTWIYNKWKKGGFDKVEQKGYDALLSYPSEKENERNKVEVVEMDEERDEYVTIFESQPETLDPTVKDENIMQAFIAYAKAGVVTGDLVYVNYCRVEDFVQLLYENVTVEGNIAICRYEKIYRGDKAKNAARFGAVGLILYTEPNFLAQVYGFPTYPDGIYLPDTGIQRGSIALENGDPQTPGYPASEGIYRTPEEDLELPTIPVQCISIRDARYLLIRMRGEPIEYPQWRGYLMNVTYRYGPGFVNSTEKVRLSVYNKNEVRKVYNIIGTIYGRSEPDRYILIGNHRDAWAYGAIDPSGATAIMMEIANVFGSLKKKMNWRPRRTIIFCSWAAEEFALIGSNEFVEDYARILTTRAVAYLNMDILVQGNFTIAASASPNLKEAMFEAAKLVPDPDGSDSTLYDIWKDRQFANRVYGLNLPPQVGPLGAGSDYASFVGQCGVSSMNAIYVPDPQSTFYSVYPLYHTVYETFHMVKNLVDPEFIYHRAFGQFYGYLLLILSNSKVLPLNCRDYAIDLATNFAQLNYTHGEVFNEQNIDLTSLTTVIDELTEATKQFHRRLNFIDTTDPLAVRIANDQLMMFERAFVDPVGLPGRPFTRNVIYA
ncbi:hypothetical protein BSL78_23044, partial [Apostichopus japonicus]